jgi:hypothetical protein
MTARASDIGLNTAPSVIILENGDTSNIVDAMSGVRKAPWISPSERIVETPISSDDPR